MEVVIEKTPYEIERGKPMPSKNHAYIQKRINQLIDRNYPDKFEILPELSLGLGQGGREKIPDLAIFQYDDIAIDFEADEVRVEKTPLAVIEILSPKQNITDLIVKSHAYFESGVKSYWLVIPALRSIYVYSGKGEYEAFTKTELLKDVQLAIELDLGQLFSKK